MRRLGIILIFLILCVNSAKATETVQYTLETPHFLFTYINNFGSPWGESYRADVTWEKVEHTQRTLESYTQYLKESFNIELKDKIKINFVFRGRILDSPLKIDVGKIEITMDKADTLIAIEALNNLLSKLNISNFAVSKLPQQVEILKQLGSDDYDPMWSPDGLKIIYKSWKDNMPDLWIRDIKANSLIRLTEDNEIEMCPQWSPDGTKIAYLSGKSLFVINSAGTDREKLFENVGAFQWSPDAKYIVAVNYVNDDYPINVIVISIDKISQPITLPYASWGWKDKFHNFQWCSPDSKLFAVIGSEEDEVWFFDKSSCLKKVKFWVEESYFNVEGFLWSPDSTKVAITGYIEKDDRKFKKGQIDKYFLIILGYQKGKIKYPLEYKKPIELLIWSRENDKVAFFNDGLYSIDIESKKIFKLKGYRLHKVKWQPSKYYPVWKDVEAGKFLLSDRQNYFVTYTENAACEFSPLNLVSPGQWNKFYQTPKRFIWFISRILDKNPKQINSLLNNLRANNFSLHPKHKKIAIVSSKDYGLNRIVIENLQEPCFWEEKFDWDLVKINEFILSSDPAKLSEEEFYEYEFRILAGFSGSGGYFLGEEEISWLKNAETVFKAKGTKLKDEYNRHLAFANSYYHMGNYEKALQEYKGMNCQWGSEEMEWLINNRELRDKGEVRIKEYSRIPVCSASIGAKVQDSRYFFISYFKGAIYRYDKHTKKHAVIFIPISEYDWADKLEWDGKILKMYLRDAAIISFDNGTNKIDGFKEYHCKYNR